MSVGSVDHFGEIGILTILSLSKHELQNRIVGATRCEVKVYGLERSWEQVD